MNNERPLTYLQAVVEQKEIPFSFSNERDSAINVYMV